MAMGGPGGYSPGPGGKLGKACPAGPLGISSARELAGGRWLTLEVDLEVSYRAVRQAVGRVAVHCAEPWFLRLGLQTYGASRNNNRRSGQAVASRAWHLIP